MLLGGLVLLGMVLSRRLIFSVSLIINSLSSVKVSSIFAILSFGGWNGLSFGDSVACLGEV